jgi:probable aminopeptidase NPEPL1
VAATLAFYREPRDLPLSDNLLIIGRAHQLRGPAVAALLPGAVPPGVWEAMIAGGTVTDDGRLAVTWLPGRPARLAAGLLPDECSRHNTPSRAWAVPHLLRSLAQSGSVSVILVPDHPSHDFALGLAVARAVSTYDARSKRPEFAVHVAFHGEHARSSEAIERIAVNADAVRRASHLVDLPPNELDPLRFVEEARAVAGRLSGVSFRSVAGERLRDEGLGGLWGVGRAATTPPALVVLDYAPVAEGPYAAWVGKGITYDTGGLSIKAKTSMPGMKADMAGAAAVLYAFEAAVRLGAPHRLTAVLCLAENAVGPNATRPDDVLRMYSGRTVEIDNTDAEGRLVLADGLAWVARNRNPSALIDLATLTGAQAVATGKRHASAYCNDEALEQQAVAAGLATGDLIHPLPYCPEYFRREFQSRVADMRNSVKDRNNAQPSCAAEFIRQHLPDDQTPWLHIDMAAPSRHQGRATGWGVGLLTTLAGVGATDYSE